MPIATKYLFIVSMDVTKEKEALFNEVYDTEHVPLLLKVPGVKAVTRWKTEPAAFNLAGERKLLDGGSEPNYVAIYEIESPDVPPEKRPSVISAHARPRPLPLRKLVGYSISCIPGPPFGPS